MRKLFTILVAVLLTASVLGSKSPEKMSYQAVIRDASDNLITDTQIGMQISILQGSASGTAVYVETQAPTTNANGLVSLEIGAGTVESGDFATIDWANGPYFIKTETAVEAPLTTYTITGTSQLLSVPYALHAKTAESVTGGITETDPVYSAWDKTTGISITESQISDLGNYIETETDPSVPIGTQIGEMQYWNGTAWVTVAATENEGATLQMIGGIPTWVGGTPPTPNVTNPTTGKIWMDRNLGASQVATSSTDANAYGDLYQWGRAADGHESRTSATTSTNATSAVPNDGNAWDGFFITEGSSPYDWLTPQDDNLWQGVSGTNNPCPSGYRLPTEAEWEAERTSWSSNNAAGAFASPLKLPVAGSRNSSNGSLSNVGSNGSYWSSTVDGTNSRYLNFNSSNAIMGSNNRARGLSVRCLKD
ncbi:MAG: hypothetical protein ACOX0M_10905 [Salinivirgaceae bacterium]